MHSHHAKFPLSTGTVVFLLRLAALCYTGSMNHDEVARLLIRIAEREGIQLFKPASTPDEGASTAEADSPALEPEALRSEKPDPQ